MIVKLQGHSYINMRWVSSYYTADACVIFKFDDKATQIFPVNDPSNACRLIFEAMATGHKTFNLELALNGIDKTEEQAQSCQ